MYVEIGFLGFEEVQFFHIYMKLGKGNIRCNCVIVKEIMEFLNIVYVGV